MKKSMLFAAAAVVAMVGCTNEDFTGFQNKAENGEMAINFGSGTKKLTRGGQLTGDKAAEALDENFVVLGIKSEGDLTDADEAQTVFDYYNVNWVENTAGTTESNSDNWEYVSQAVNGLSSLTSQTIKYWDFAKQQYDYIAFSKGVQGTASTKTIDQLFTKVNLANVGKSDADGNPLTAYTVMGTLEELKNCYIADLVTVYNPNVTLATGAPEQPRFAQDAVTPVFRRLQSKIRVAFYETVPGYSVKDVKFYKDADDATTSGTTPYLYSAEAKLAVGKDAEGIMEVSFPTVGKDNVAKEDYNKASIKFSTLTGSSLSKEITFKNNDDTDIELSYTAKEKDEKTTGDVFLGRSSNNATYIGENTEDKDYAYVAVLPTGEGTVLNLKVDYTLESIDGSGEEINVVGATAQVPAVYTEWQPNYAYTYIFKISDQTNGLTDPAQPGYVGLYPITFDAIVEGDIDGIQETITEVGAPSITTYQAKKNVTENDEYLSGKPIYVTVDNGAELTDKAWKLGATNIFTATLDDENPCQTLSEKAVANCFNSTAFDPTGVSDTYTVKDANDQELTLTALTSGWSLEKTIAQADAPHGVVINTDGDNTCVAKIASPVAGKTYVFQYLKTPATYKTPLYNTVAPGTYYAWDATNLVFETVTADGTETRTDLYSAQTDAVFYTDAATDFTFNTLATGTEYYVYDATAKTYTKKYATGTEVQSDTYFTVTFAKPTDNKITSGTTYYEKLGNSNVYVVKTAPTADMTITDKDPYYIASVAPAVVTDDKYNTLATGANNYWTVDQSLGTNITKYIPGKATGTETYFADKYVKTLPTVSTAVLANTIAKGTKYYTGTSDDGTGAAVPVLVTAAGTETSVDGKVVNTNPVYYYKVIRIAE